ncbi:MAG: cobalamin-binding protein [Alphaproteobacteria bacterium]|nr:cobalamin-binding protein [Alphaproteobacteria bacterium]
MTRIVSLLASATEIVAALGFEDSLVARSHECDFPRGVKHLPSCTEPKIDVSGSSREIDERVKQVVEEGLSVYRVDSDALKALKPDVIVTQSQCEVCAVSEKDLLQAVRDWLEDRPDIVTLKPDSLADIWVDFTNVARALHAEDRAADLVQRLQSRMRDIADATARSDTRPTIACIEWIDPLMAAGNWVPELVAMAGGRDLFGTAGKHAPWMTWDDLVEADPEVIAVMPCGFDIERARQDMPVLTDRPDWQNLRAVRNGRVCITDGNQYFNRPGPRVADSLEILAEILHPAQFDFGHKGVGWEPL